MKLFLVKIFIALLATGVYFLPSSESRLKTLSAAERWEMLFRERSNDDWQKVWHSEFHSRCRDHLVRHLFWACNNDIYRTTDKTSIKRGIPVPAYIPMSANWLHMEEAQVFLRTVRANQPTLTSECCSLKGCNWEEYAEYCPSNKREHHSSYGMK